MVDRVGGGSGGSGRLLRRDLDAADRTDGVAQRDAAQSVRDEHRREPAAPLLGALGGGRRGDGLAALGHVVDRRGGRREGLVVLAGRAAGLGWHRVPDQAVLLLEEEHLIALRVEGWPVRPGDLGENLLVAGLPASEWRVGARLRLGEAALEWTHAASFDWGVLQPQISAAARHEFEDEGRVLRGQFVGDPASGMFVLPTDPADDTYFAARAGLSAIFPRGWALYAHGESEFGRDDLSVTTLSAGFRIEW